MQELRDIETEIYQILDFDGNADEEALSQLDLDDSLLLSMYEWMVKARKMDERLLRMQRQGRIGTYSPFSGQEASQIGSAIALKKSDWMFPSYRDMAASLVHGVPISQVVKYFSGHIDGSNAPEHVNVLPIQIIIAGQIPQATGCAWASKLRNEDDVTITYFGDGATSQGDFHEGLNFAAVHDVPAIFFCQNNQWAISVPFHKQSGSETVAEKAAAYGMKGIRVDGNDILAVYHVTQEAIRRGRNGEGPTLIEAVTYRIGPHTTSDDPTKYRDNEKVIQKWTGKKDPINRFETYLVKNDLLTEEQIEKIADRTETEVLEEIKIAEESTPTRLEQVFDHVYDKPHALLEEQKDEVIAKKQEGDHRG